MWQLSGSCLQQGSGRLGTGNEIFLWLFLPDGKDFESGWGELTKKKKERGWWNRNGYLLSWMLVLNFIRKLWWIMGILLLHVDRSGWMLSTMIGKNMYLQGLYKICILILECLLELIRNWSEPYGTSVNLFIMLSSLVHLGYMRIHVILRYFQFSLVILSFPSGSDGKDGKWGRPSFDPQVGKIPWRRKLQPTPIFLPGEPHGQRRLAMGSQELDMTEWLTLFIFT